MSNCGCHQTATTDNERKILQIALILNATMFVVGLIAGILAHSTGLIADSLDMLADASAYTIGLYAIGRSLRLKSIAATLSGSLLLVLGVGVLVEVIRRTWLGSVPESTTMIIVASISLLVNSNVLRLLSQFRKAEAHLRATWIFTRADVIVNLGVIISGILVALTHSRFPDLLVGFAIGLYVIKEAFGILKDARLSS
ncbi:MAG: cation diffusion facilitator family transporter [Gammaproteobacteria bacterium]|nr:cation diffusion facilitator family transporter [Gammaproteobacteria bacterium]